MGADALIPCDGRSLAPTDGIVVWVITNAVVCIQKVSNILSDIDIYSIQPKDPTN